MKLEEIIREAGVCLELFPKCCQRDVILYDDDGQLSELEHLYLNPKFFEDNFDSFVKFVDFLESMESSSINSAINVQITEEHLILFFRTPHPKLFFRKAPDNHLDCEDWKRTQSPKKWLCSFYLITLFSIFYCTSFSYYIYFYLSWIFHICFYFFSHISC